MKNKNSIVLGIFCIIISGLGFSIMSLFVKMSGDLPALQKSFFRNLISAIIASIPLLTSKFNVKLPSGKVEWQVLVMRAIFGTLGIVLNFYAIGHINLADSSILQRLSPFVILILSYFIFKEKMSKFQIFAIILSFIGILFVVKPTFSGINSGTLAGLSSALFAGTAYTCVRYLGMREISGQFIIFFFSIFSCVSLVPFLILNYVPMTTSQIVMLILAGCASTMGQFGITYAYRFAPAKNIAAFDYLQVLFAGLLGFIFFMEIPDMYSLLGYLIVISVGIVLAIRKK